jgi:Leucine-rich repeat (LRR) protein
LGNMDNLYALSLSNNQLTGSIPAELGNLSRLTQLTVNDNNLTGPIPHELGDLSKLSWLDLFGNQLTCWETTDVRAWANQVRWRNWDYPYPGQVVCPADISG